MGEHYIIIPESVYTFYKPSPAVLYGLLTSLSLKEGYCWISNKELSQLFNVDISTIKRLIKNLKRNNFIKTEGKTKRKIYVLTRGKSEPYKGQKITVARGTNEPLNGSKTSPNNNIYNYRDINTATEKNKSRKSSYDIDELMKIE